MFPLSRLRLLACLQHFSPRKVLLDLQKPSSAIPYIGYLSNLVLLGALGFGLYARWMHSQDIAVIFIALLGLFVFASSCTLVYYFSMETAGYCLFHLWIGCLVGVVAFTTEHSIVEHGSVKGIVEVMDVMFVSSLLLSCTCSIVERFFIQGFASEKASINKMDSMEMVGMAIASMVTGNDATSIALMLLALSVITVTLRLKSFLGFLNLLAFIAATSVVFFPKMMQMPANPFALSCFLGRTAFEPFIDIFLSHLTILQRWEPLTSKSPFKRRLLILMVTAVQWTFYVQCAMRMPLHKEWLVVVPMFGAFSVIWFLFHLVFLIIIWQLSNKITECNATFESLRDENSSMMRIMEAKGLRHFALISQRVAFITFVTTIIIGGLHWTIKTGPSFALWFITMPLEIAVVSLLWELGHVLGGTCIGYALVAPSCFVFNSHKSGDSGPLMDSVQNVTSRIMRIINCLQQFFSHNLIEVHGCDHSIDGFSLEALEAKVKPFLQRTTADGPRFDTYLLYFSGPVFENGDWMLQGNQSLTLQKLMEWWHECDNYSGTRLILVMDTEFSFRWIREIIRMRRDFIGLQTYLVLKKEDPEEYLQARVGDFTEDWTDYNSMNMKNVNWRDRKRVLRPVYGISRCFPNFTFHLPNQEDITRYWDANFPKVTRPLLKLTNFPHFSHLLCICHCVMACLKRWKVIFLSPKFFDTGHGFKLVR